MPKKFLFLKLVRLDDHRISANVGNFPLYLKNQSSFFNHHILNQCSEMHSCQKWGTCPAHCLARKCTVRTVLFLGRECEFGACRNQNDVTRRERAMDLDRRTDHDAPIDWRCPSRTVHPLFVSLTLSLFEHVDSCSFRP